jgi:hypothetical protein
VNAVIAAYDFARWGQIAYIGGGDGHLWRAISEAAPGAEVITFSMEVLHDWPDKQYGAILSAIPDAAPDNATVLVVEDLMPEEQSGPSVSNLDVIMLTMTGGRERTVAQLRNPFGCRL